MANQARSAGAGTPADPHLDFPRVLVALFHNNNSPS